MKTLLRLTAALVGLALALMLMPTATAQANPHAKVSIEMTTDPEEVAAGSEITRPATVSLEASNFTCEQESELVVDLTVSGGTEDAAAGGGNTSAGATGNDTGAAGGLVVSVEPTQLNYTVSGTHQNIAGGPASYNESADATLTIFVGEDTPPGPNDIALTATFSEQLPQGCQAMGQLPQSSATANFTIIMPEPEGEEDAFGNETDEDGAVGNDTADGDSPSPGGALMAAALGVAFLAAAAVQRRKGY